MPEGQQRLSLLSRFVAGLIRFVTGVRSFQVRPVARQQTCPVVYFANHGSHLDTAVIWAAMPTDERARLRPVAAEDYWQKTRLRRAISGMMNCVYIPRVKISRENSPLPRLVEALEAGSALLIFPHGTRKSRGDGRAKSGIYHLARKVPELICVPTYLQNVSRILPAGEWMPLPLIARLEIGAPLSIQPEESREAFVARLEEALNALAPD